MDKNLYDKYSKVIELTSKDFKIEKNKVTIINKNFKNKYGFINFYAPWCKHCQQMVEIWSDIAIQFSNQFTIGAVNCEKQNNLKICRKLKIKEYPHIMVVSKTGSLSAYTDNYTKDEFIYNICSRL